VTMIAPNTRGPFLFVSSIFYLFSAALKPFSCGVIWLY
jgi:hypothetical protein